MTAPVYSRAAQGDLQDIWAYVAQHNPEAADDLEADIRAEAEHLRHCHHWGTAVAISPGMICGFALSGRTI